MDFSTLELSSYYLIMNELPTVWNSFYLPVWYTFSECINFTFFKFTPSSCTTMNEKGFKVKNDRKFRSSSIFQWVILMIPIKRIYVCVLWNIRLNLWNYFLDCNWFTWTSCGVCFVRLFYSIVFHVGR